jgi:transcriptional regulator CtsR
MFGKPTKSHSRSFCSIRHIQDHITYKIGNKLVKEATTLVIQLLFSNNLNLEIKKKLIKHCIWSVAFYVSETWILGENKQRVVNAFETRCWRRMLQIKWTDGITND